MPFARLRTEADMHLFTVKVSGSNELDCAEHETVVADRDQMPPSSRWDSPDGADREVPSLRQVG